MYKTVWFIKDEKDEYATEFTYYHFGATPKIAPWYFEAEAVYTVEMLWNLKLIFTPKTFFKCLTHHWNAKFSKNA